MELHQHWAGRERYTIFDSHYGDGAAVAALIRKWHEDPQRPRHLHIVALDASLQPGFHRSPQAEPGVTLDLLSAPIDEALAQLMARIDFAWLHGIEAAGTDYAAGLARLAAAGARLEGQALDGQQLAALAAHGFAFDTAGGDVQRAVFASRKPRPPLPPAPPRRAIVIGAGLAGSAACERLCARGWEVTLIERNARPAMEASGNHAGIYMPLVSRDDNIQTRLIRSSYLYALRYWEGLGGFGGAIEGAACGVIQMARDEENAQVQRAIASERRYPPAFAQWLEPDAAQAVAGVPVPYGGWLFPQSGWAHPASMCEAMLAACGERLSARFGTGS
ncbi:MAG TPA: FAD-dependent oxidoreductase, partial [Telluria sp.]|nr:FAD-dependent oxidoreductase [Telluria sp.]